MRVAKEVCLGLVSTRMSRIAFHLDYFVYPIIIAACLTLAIRSATLSMVAADLMIGLAVWTLAEYLLHRYVLHHWPYFSVAHKAHHDEPRAMIATPTLFTLLVFVTLAYLPAWAMIDRSTASAFFSGFLLGYVCFGAVHEAVHHSASQNRVMRCYKKLHAIHHHGNSTKNFGVITSFWDRVFGTYSDSISKRPNI